jgi:hypothetical protein
LGAVVVGDVSFGCSPCRRHFAKTNATARHMSLQDNFRRLSCTLHFTHTAAWGWHRRHKVEAHDSGSVVFHTLVAWCPWNHQTTLQNDPKQHKREANHRTRRVSRGGTRSPDSESARRELSKSGLASHSCPQTCDFTSNSGGGTRIRPSRIQYATEELSRTPCG